MTKIKPNLSRLEFASLVVKQLKLNNISSVLVGGSCVSIYTNEKYVSDDLDFISPYSDQIIEHALSKIGFIKANRYYKHPDSDFFVEFPSGPIAIGNRINIKAEATKEIDGVTIHLLSPTQSVMDRLSGWYHWNDRRSLIQAIDIAILQSVDLEVIKKWSIEENHLKDYEEFIILLNKEHK